MGKLLYGTGINDSEEQISWKIDGHVSYCPYYSKWKEMIRRCYSSSFHKIHPTYLNCIVCEEWLYFSNFKNWMINQDWNKKDLDKDLLSNSKIYSPETCVFIDPKLNAFLTLSTASRGEFPIGVGWTPNKKKYRAMIGAKYIGSFETILEAHKAWQREKLSQAQVYLDSTIDTRIKDGIQRIITLLQEDLENDRITTRF